MRIVFAFTLTCCSAFSASAPGRAVVTECPEGSGVPICQIRNGWSFRFDTVTNRIPLVYGVDGRFRFPLPFQLPGADVSYAYDIAPDTDGSFVVAAAGGAADMRHWQRSGLVMFDPTGRQTAFIDTGEFRCAHVAITPDGSIWAAGAQYNGNREQQQYAILRKYSRTGELLGSFLDRSTFPPGLSPGGPTPGPALFAAGNLIALMAYSGNVGNRRELIELDSDGKLLGRMRFDDPYREFYAFAPPGTSAGTFYAGPMGPAEPVKQAVLQLDPVTGAAREVDSPGTPWTMYGADGPNLLYRTVTADGYLKIAWFPPPAN